MVSPLKPHEAARILCTLEYSQIHQLCRLKSMNALSANENLAKSPHPQDFTTGVSIQILIY